MQFTVGPIELSAAEEGIRLVANTAIVHCGLTTATFPCWKSLNKIVFDAMRNNRQVWAAVVLAPMIHMRKMEWAIHGGGNRSSWESFHDDASASYKASTLWLPFDQARTFDDDSLVIFDNEETWALDSEASMKISFSVQTEL